MKIDKVAIEDAAKKMLAERERQRMVLLIVMTSLILMLYDDIST